MLKVKRFNAYEYCKQNRVNYIAYDTIRITTIERLVKQYPNMSKADMTDIILSLVKNHLDKILVETK